MFANISENFLFKPQDCNLGTIINSDCYLDTSLWSPSSSKLNPPSHPSESFFSTSNDSERVMHNKYMIHRQLLSLLSNKSLICYLVNIVTLKILNESHSLSHISGIHKMQYTAAIQGPATSVYSIYTQTIIKKTVQRALKC